MSDQDYERAQKAVTFIVDEVGSGEYAVSALFEELAGEFAAVRLAERERIATYLLGVCASERAKGERAQTRMNPWVMLEMEAFWIKRGGHEVAP